MAHVYQTDGQTDDNISTAKTELAGRRAVYTALMKARIAALYNCYYVITDTGDDEDLSFGVYYFPQCRNRQ